MNNRDIFEYIKEYTGKWMQQRPILYNMLKSIEVRRVNEFGCIITIIVTTGVKNKLYKELTWSCQEAILFEYLVSMQKGGKEQIDKFLGYTLEAMLRKLFFSITEPAKEPVYI